jgi:cysteine desulfurase
VKEIAKITAAKGIALYADALAAAGWMPIDVQDLGVQLLSFSPHRFYGPKGIGVLYRNRKARVTSHIHGGVQEGGRRAGTENVPAIIGAGVAAEFAVKEMAQRVEHVAMLQKRLYDGMWKHIQYLKLNGPVPGPLRICNTLNLSTEFIEGGKASSCCSITRASPSPADRAASANRSRFPTSSAPSSSTTHSPRATSS